MTNPTDNSPQDALSELRQRFNEWEREEGEPIYVIEAVSKLLKSSNKKIIERLSRTPPADEAWRDCRIGSCHRHEKCMYHPCRNPKPATADDVERARQLIAAYLEHEDADYRSDDVRNGQADECIGKAIAAKPPADEAIVGRLREAIDTERRRWFCSGHDCEPYDHGRDEGFEFALKAFDDVLASLPDTSATVTDGDSARVSDTSGDGV